MTSKILFISVAIVLIIVSFFVGYSVNKPYSSSIDIQNFQTQINELQQQNSQLQNQVSNLQNQIRDGDNSNDSPDSETGASGKVEFGMGDCMPCACNGEDCSGCPSRSYAPFNGEIFFIVKSKLDSLGNGNFTSLLESSAKTSVTNGNYKINLEVEEYVVMPRDVYQYSGNFINITSGT